MQGGERHARKSHHSFSRVVSRAGGRKTGRQMFNYVHSNGIIVCHYVGTTLSITWPCSPLRLCRTKTTSERIKTFICMIMFALNGHEWQFDFSGEWREEAETTRVRHLLLLSADIFANNKSFKAFYFRVRKGRGWGGRMEIYLNSFCRITLRMNFIFECTQLTQTHDDDDDDMTIYGKWVSRFDACCCLSRATVLEWVQLL